MLSKGLEDKMQAEVNFHGRHERNKADIVFSKTHKKDQLSGRLLSPVISGSELIMTYK